MLWQKLGQFFHDNFASFNFIWCIKIHYNPRVKIATNLSVYNNRYTILDYRLISFHAVYQYQGLIVNWQTGLTKNILTLKDLLYPLNGPLGLISRFLRDQWCINNFDTLLELLCEGLESRACGETPQGYAKCWLETSIGCGDAKLYTRLISDDWYDEDAE